MKFRSKWGQGYLVEHAPTATPYGTPERYYLRCGACDASPYLEGVTYNWGQPIRSTLYRQVVIMLIRICTTAVS